MKNIRIFDRNEMMCSICMRMLNSRAEWNAGMQTLKAMHPELKRC